MNLTKIRKSLKELGDKKTLLYEKERELTPEFRVGLNEQGAHILNVIITNSGIYINGNGNLIKKGAPHEFAGGSLNLTDGMAKELYKILKKIYEL